MYKRQSFFTVPFIHRFYQPIMAPSPQTLKLTFLQFKTKPDPFSPEAVVSLLEQVIYREKEGSDQYKTPVMLTPQALRKA